VSFHRRLIISDMDRTLVNFTSHYVGAYGVAVRSAYGIEAQPDPRKASGHTQATVMRMLCQEHGLDAEATEAGLEEALRVLSTTVISQLAEDLHDGILPGVEAVFGELQRRGHALALVTGTVSAIAEAMLSRSGLDHFFLVRACGEEASARTELLRLARRRADDAYGVHTSWGDVVVIGDALTDIEAGKAVGARAVAVATGHFTSSELAERGPDAILDDLADLEAALAAILG
jgi:phosphoglycolate phosphatase-like HAD superfamily hydrolase